MPISSGPRSVYSIYSRTGDPRASEASLIAYRRARDNWSVMAKKASDVYKPDISYGEIAIRRGDWLDRLSIIEDDLTTLEQYFAANAEQTGSASIALANLAKTPTRTSFAIEQLLPPPFARGVISLFPSLRLNL